MDTLLPPEVKITALVFAPAGVTVKDHPRRLTVGKDTQFLRTLRVKIGARVMLISNINVSDRLANGTMRKVLDISYNRENVDCMIVSFDDERVGVQQRD